MGSYETCPQCETTVTIVIAHGPEMASYRPCGHRVLPPIG